MTAIVVRGLEPEVKDQLAQRARSNGRSMEAEVRAILTRAARGPNIALALREAVLACGGVDELPIPPRVDEARAVHLE